MSQLPPSTSHEGVFRGKVTKVAANGRPFVEVPQLTLGSEYGPLDKPFGVTFAKGDRVLVAFLRGSVDDPIVLTKLQEFYEAIPDEPTTEVPGGVTPIPVPPAEVDRSQRIDNAVAQFVAEFMNSDGSVHDEIDDELVTSMGQALGMLISVIVGDRGSFDLMRDFGNATLLRNNNGISRAPGMYCRTFDIGSDAITDPTFHVGAELLRVLALASAYQRWNRQDYLNDLNRLHDDLKSEALNTDEGRYFPVYDGLQKQNVRRNGHHDISGGETWEMKIGDSIPIAWRILDLLSGEQIWKQVQVGHWEYLAKATDGGSLGASAGLPPDSSDFRTTNHRPNIISVGQEGWTIDRSIGFTGDAARAMIWAYADKQNYGEQRATNYLSGPVADWAATAWASSAKFVASYSHAGAGQVSTQDNLIAFAGRFALLADGNTTVANNIYDTWLDELTVVNSFGTLFRRIPAPGTPTSTMLGNAWMVIAESIDSGRFNQMTQLPGLAGKYSPVNLGEPTGTPPEEPEEPEVPDPEPETPTTPTTPTNPGGSTPPPPQGTKKLWINLQNQFGNWATGLDPVSNPTKKARAMERANHAMGLWTGPEWDSSGSIVNDACGRAPADEYVIIMAYGIPGRDMGGSSAGGSAGANEYRTWTNNILAASAGQNCIWVLEPDALPQIINQPAAEVDARCALVAEFIGKIRAQKPNDLIYLDAGHSQWLRANAMVPLLLKARIDLCHGFSGNVSNFRPIPEVIAWANEFFGMLNLPNLGFCIDTARNGGNPPNPPDWLNPDHPTAKGRQFGMNPQFGNLEAIHPKLHFVAWLKVPGESDGNGSNEVTNNGNGGPPAGVFWADYVWTNGANDNSPTAAMMQRPYDGVGAPGM